MKRNLRKQLIELLKELNLPVFREYHAEYAVKAMNMSQACSLGSPGLL